MGADLISPSSRVVTREDGIGEVSTLLGLISDEVGSFEVGLRYIQVENSGSC